MTSSAYRDARISRIYEGTNEINRLLIVGMLLKKAIKKELPIFQKAKKIGKDLVSITSFFKKNKSYTGKLSDEKKHVNNMKKAILMVLGKAAAIFKEKIEHEQELLLKIADMVIETYMAESALLRAEKLNKNNHLQIYIAKNYLIRALEICQKNGHQTICSFDINATTKKIMIRGIDKFCKKPNYNIVEIRRKIANDVIKKGKYSYYI